MSACGRTTEVAPGSLTASQGVSGVCLSTVGELRWYDDDRTGWEQALPVSIHQVHQRAGRTVNLFALLHRRKKAKKANGRMVARATVLTRKNNCWLMLDRRRHHQLVHALLLFLSHECLNVIQCRQTHRRQVTHTMAGRLDYKGLTRALLPCPPSCAERAALA